MDAMAGKASGRGRDWLLPGLLLTFVAGLFPFASEYVLFHPDERHYVDAGMGMLRSGDFLTPRHANGDLRLKKPLLPYWVAAAGFATVGVSPLGGRIGFLLAGAAVVWLTWKTACVASEWQAHSVCRRDPNRTQLAPLLAAAIAACHPALLISASRSVPDVCLTLCVATSMWGFVGMLAHETARLRWIAAAFGGGALAVLSKGLPGAAFVVFATAFLVWRCPTITRRHWRPLLCAAMVSAAVSGSWFAYIAARHQDELARQFVNDQIGSQRFVDSGWQAAAQFPAYAAIIAATMLPWVSALLRSTPHPRPLSPLDADTKRKRLGGERGDRSSWRDAISRPQIQLLLGWTLLYCGLASFVNHVSPRYLLPVVPAISIVVGDLLSRVGTEALRRGLRRLLGVSIGGVAIAAAMAVLVMGSRAMSPRAETRFLQETGFLVSMLCITVLLFSALLWRKSVRWGRAGQVGGVAMCVHAMLLIGGLTLHRALPDTFAEQVHTQLLANGANGGRVIVIGAPAHATRLRVELHGTHEVVWGGDTTLPRDVRSSDVIVLDERIANQSGLAVEQSTLVTCGYRESNPRDVVSAVISGQLAQYLAEHQKQYIVAIRGSEDETPADIIQAGAWEQSR